MRRSDLALRALALAIALGLFLLVSGDRRVTANYTVPLVTELPPGATVDAAPPAEVSVALSGPWARLRGVDPAALGPIHVDLTQETSGLHTWYVRPEALRLPRGVRVETIHPAQGSIELRRGEFR
ncbi:hypothetical protein [Anaeromyxobacter oryzae]|uniref:Uncharacterized protein n=1 Tax=Anaeromyxobacter oryzae TaxID=2918170 RepID=A0ABM7X3G5_9BACT|nr:hypothetical protein [Anaeromyxobacter oryzae]BDG06348.1 hypothetical protein AMOR_53440 [Anaeromyxobacter oryzae]